MESTFAGQFHTNYVPSGSEVEKIRNIVSGSLEERARLEEKIARFRVIIDDLHDQHDKLSVYTEDHLALTSGARRLPRDIVQVIFCHCLPTDNFAVMSVTEPPLLLGRICNGWRRIAFSTPELWATLHVSIPNCQIAVHYIKWRKVVEAVKTWLDLSGNLPLSISAACAALAGGQPDRETSLNINYLMNILIRHSRRWERVDFTLPLPEFIATMASLTEADVPLLKSITLESTVFTSTNPWPPIGILNTTSLREISIISFKLTDYLHPIPWAQLTGLYLEDSSHIWSGTQSLNETDVLNMLRQCSMLETCKLLVESGPSSPLPQLILQEVTLPFLRSLILIEGTNMLGTQFVDCLKLPVLSYLGFRSYFVYDTNHLPFTLTAFFTRENDIEELELEVCVTSVEVWKESLSCAKHIKRLTLNAPLWVFPTPALNDHFLFCLTPFPDDGLLCPSLEEITLRFCQGMSDDKILLFLQERTNPTNVADGMAVLKRATFVLKREMVTDILPDAQPLIVAGLKLDLRYISPAVSVIEEETQVVDVPGGPKLMINYFPRVPEEAFSPRHGLRSSRMMNTVT